MRDPLAFLSKNGEILPKGMDLRLYENDWDPKNLSFHEFELDTTLPLPGAPVGGETGVTSCPAGQRRYKTLQKRFVCIKKGVSKGSLEWIADDSNPRAGHFGYPNSMEVCLQWMETEVWVWVCLRAIELPDQDRVYPRPL